MIDFVDNTPTVRVLFSGIDLDSNFDGHMTLLGFLPLDGAALKLKNLTIQLDLLVVPLENDTARW